ncbi:MAG: DNA polymerase I [Gemmatimonadales bacterium]
MSDDNSRTPRTLFLLDGHALVYRAFYAMISRPLTTSSGENTSAPFGLARFLIRILDDFAPDYIGVVFDAGDSYRTEVFPEYKATREKMPEELALSLPRCREVVEGFRVPAIEIEGWEADDVIGTLAAQASKQGIHTVIVSGDKDFYQLIDANTHLLNPGRGGAAGIEEKEVTPDNASERLGVDPGHVTDYLALIGDSSDNIPGVRGIGPKTAPGLIEKYGSLEEILDHAEEFDSKRVRNALLKYRDEALLSKRLVTIRRDAPIELDLEALRREPPDRARLRDLFLALEFHTLARDYAPEAAVEVVDEVEAREDGEGGETAIELEVVTDAGRLPDVTAALREAPRIGVRTLAIGSGARSTLVGLGVAATSDRAWYLSFGHRPARHPTDVDGNPVLALDDANHGVEDVNLPPWDAPELAELRALLEDPARPKWSGDAKHDLHALRAATGGEADGGPGTAALAGVTFDASLAAYCLDPGKRRHELELVSLDRLGRHVPSLAELCGSGRSAVPPDEVPAEEAAAHAAGGAAALLGFGGPMMEDLETYAMTRLIERVELPLVEVLADMEDVGIRIDLEFFAELDRRLERDIELVQEEIYKIAGGEVNLRSVPQLRELLFEQLELPVVKKTKTGPSTDEAVLTELAAEGHDVPRLIIEHRELDKLRSTYVTKLPQMIDPETGRIHTSFNQTVAATGRLSSSDPNLQNIPIRSSLGREIRKGFVPAEGCLFVSADYSQIELRVLAHLSGDPAFVTAFREGRDIHRETAARIFGVDADDVTAAMRDQAKTINFATIYGQGPVALAAQLGISRSQASEFIDNYFRRFEGVANYLEEMKELARTQGYVETLLGRRRYIPEIRARNPGMRGFGERTATNSPIQGTAADLIKLAMIRLHERLADSPSRMLLQVHDELLFEAPSEDAGSIGALVREEMEGAIELDVPLRVDLGVGASWYASKGG